MYQEKKITAILENKSEINPSLRVHSYSVRYL